MEQVMTPLPSEVTYDRDETPLTIGEWSRAFDSKNPLATRADRDAVRESLDPSLLIDCRSTPRRPLTDPDLTHDWTPQHYPSGAIGGYYCPDCLIAGAPTSTLCPDRVAHVVRERDEARAALSSATVRTHTHRVTEASFIVGNEAAILGVLEGRDREIEALRARVGWEVAERNREAGARNVATAVDLGAIQATLLDALEAVDRRAEINRRLSTCSGPSPEFDAAMDAERVACDAWFAALTAWREAGYPRALATARLDGARAMRERCIIVCENVEGEADADGESGRALAAHHIAQRIGNLTVDPAAVVGSGS